MVEKQPQAQPQAQKIRYSDKELQLLKNTFVDRDDILKAIRKVMLQMELTDEEKSLLDVTMQGEMPALMRKFFLPTLDGDAPFHQVVDLFMTVKIDDKTPEEAHPHLMARGILIDYIDQQLDVLAGKDVEIKTTLLELSDIKPTSADSGMNFIGLVARNTIIMHVEQQLPQIKTLAGLKDETPEETLKRIQQDSAK